MIYNNRTPLRATSIEEQKNNKRTTHPSPTPPPRSRSRPIPQPSYLLSSSPTASTNIKPDKEEESKKEFNKVMQPSTANKKTKHNRNKCSTSFTAKPKATSSRQG